MKRTITDHLTFQQEYLCSWPYNEETLELHKRMDEAAEEYEHRCESFDRVVCQFRNEQDIAMPLNSYEAGAINKHALKVRKEIMAKYSLSPKRFHEALRRWDKAYRK